MFHSALPDYIGISEGGIFWRRGPEGQSLFVDAVPAKVAQQSPGRIPDDSKHGSDLSFQMSPFVG
jgi:hypothetical protein